MDLTIVKLPALPTRPYVPGEKLVPCYAPKKERFPDNSVDMGTGYDCFDTLSHTLDPRIKGTQRANRLLLKGAMEAQGFVNLAEEWWHYTFRPEPFPDTYFDFPVARRSLPG
jgi:D-alanyl-D-alanine dipeptidase